jgi:hypothetical protein
MVYKTRKRAYIQKKTDMSLYLLCETQRQLCVPQALILKTLHFYTKYKYTDVFVMDFITNSTVFTARYELYN